VTDESPKVPTRAEADAIELTHEERAFRRELLDAATELDRPAAGLEGRLLDQIAPGAAAAPRPRGRFAGPRAVLLAALAMAACVGVGVMLGRSGDDDSVAVAPEPRSAVAQPSVPTQRSLPRFHPCNYRYRAEGTIALIDDFEDGDSAALRAEGRGSPWMVHFDYVEEGSAPFMPRPEKLPQRGPHGRWALHVTGKRLLDWGAVLEVRFDPHHCYDMSAYAGLTFWAKGPGRIFAGAREVRETDVKWGGTCEKDCYNVHTKRVDLDHSWKQYEVRWSEMLQRGYDMPPLDPTSINAIQFSVNAADTPFDFWIDDVAFLQR